MIRHTKKPEVLDNYKCTHCGMRYKDKRKACFYCGKSDTIHYNQIKELPKKKKSDAGGPILRINLK